MATNVKFFKIGAESTATIETYEAGAIYFDEKTKQIKLGNGTATPTVYGGKLADATYVDDKLTISFSDGKTEAIVLDFSDCASASEMAGRLADCLTQVVGTGAITVTTLGIVGDDNSIVGKKATIGIKINNSAESDIDLEQTTDGISAKTALASDVAVAGGPLADDVLNDTWPTGWTNADGAKIIPAGKTLKEILEGLFLKVVNGTVSFSYSTWNPVLGNPTTKLSSTAAQEVNASVTPTASGNSTVTGNSVTATGKATQGYFLTTDGAWKSGNYTQTINGSITSSPTISSTWNGAAYTSGAVKCVEGTNTFKVNNTGCKVKMGNYAAQTIYASTNTKQCLPAVSAVLDVDANAGEKTITSSATATVNAYYPIYTNGVTSSTTDTSAPTVTATADATKLPLVANGTTFGVAFAAMVVGGTGYRLLLRSGKKISSAKKLNGLTAKYDLDVTSSFVKNTTAITKQSGGTDETYYAWEYKGTDGANRVIFTIANE